MAPSREIGIIIKFTSKPSSVIVAFNIEDASSNARNIIVIDIRNEMCLVDGSYEKNNKPDCNFDEINNELIISGREGLTFFGQGDKAIVIPLYSTDLP